MRSERLILSETFIYGLELLAALYSRDHGAVSSLDQGMPYICVPI